jgi:hypothetical protein
MEMAEKARREKACRIEALEAENTRLRAAMEWRLIETAPRDKSHVALLRRNGDGSVTYGHGYYMPLEGWKCWQHYANKPPTYWMPLPTAPEGEG